MADTIPSYFRSAAAKYKGNSVFRFFEGAWNSLNYDDFSSLADSYLSLLVQNEIHKGDRIAIISENRPEWCASYLAAVGCGCIAVPIDIQLGSDEIRNIILDSGAKIFFCSNKTRSNLSEAIKGTGIREINFDTPQSRSPHLLSPQPSDPAAIQYPVSSGDVASIIYTSGTTGTPKGVMLTHKNFCSDAEALIRLKVVSSEDNVLAVLPLHHTYPFMCTFLVPLFLGATITIGPGLKAPELLSAIKENGVTVLVGVPRLFDMLRNGILSRIVERRALSGLLFGMLRLSGKLRRKFDVNIGRIIFSSLHNNFRGIKFFTSGGARLDPEVMSDLEAMGFTVLEGYGLTETSPVITFNPVDKRKPGSAGKPLPDAEIRILDDGEISVRGPMVMKGYYGNETATGESLKDGWLLTGDLGNLDEEGYLFITGRKKEVIVLSSGKNIYPEDVEKAYASIPLIKEICVAGDDRHGRVDVIRAVIVPDLDYAKQHSVGNINDDLSWKINEVSMRLPEYMRIRGYILTSGPLPRTPLGKLRRFMVQDFFQKQGHPARAVREEEPQLMEDTIGRKVVSCISALLEEGAVIRFADNLELDLGLDSLSKIELIASLEAAFAVEIPDTFISEALTVGDIIAAIKSYQGLGTPGRTGEASWKSILEKEPSPEDANKIGYKHSLPEIALIFVIFMALKIFCKLVFRLKVEGREDIPEEGPFVITPNHASFMDGFIVAASVRFTTFRKLYFLGLQEYFTGRTKSWLARLSHVIPIDAEIYLNKALQLSSYVLKSRRSLCIFPEGGRSFDGSVMPFKKGIGVLAIEMNVPVVPAFINGTFNALPRGSFFIRPVQIKVVFGKKILPRDITFEQDKGADKHQMFSDELRERVIELAYNRSL